MNRKRTGRLSFLHDHRALKPFAGFEGALAYHRGVEMLLPDHLMA